MKAKNYRIGNLITIDNKELHPTLVGVVMEVISIGTTKPINGLSDTDYGVSVNVLGNTRRITEPEYSQFIRYVKPIEITEEWLIDFGFNLVVKEGNQGEFRVYQLNEITYNTNHGWWWKHYLIVQPKYVHQLQNLYFAITGQELTINQK